jgi:pimeloyl-ACP methyl ester carboxylesterase
VSLALLAPVGPAGSPTPPDVLAFLHRMIDDDAAAHEGLAMGYGDYLWPRWVTFKVARWRDSATVPAAHGYLDMFTGTDLSAEAKGLKTPVLLVVGAHDRNYGEVATRAAFLPVYPHAKVVVCESAGHYPMQETPVLLASTLERYWQSLRA